MIESHAHAIDQVGELGLHIEHWESVVGQAMGVSAVQCTFDERTPKEDVKSIHESNVY